jgi:hypothetical protein
MTVPVPPNLPDLETVFKTPPSQLPRNKRAEDLHNHEVWVQVYLPMLIGGLVLLGVILFVGWAAFLGGRAGDVRLWADVSTIVVVLQALIGLLPLLLVIIGVTYGLYYVVGILPPYFKVAQDYSAWLAYKTNWAVKFVTQPMTQVKSSVAGLDGFIKGIRKFFGR